MGPEIGVVQVVVNLLAQPPVLRLVQNEVSELSLVDSNDFRESAFRCAVPFHLVEEARENGVVRCAFEVLAAVVQRLVCNATER